MNRANNRRFIKNAAVMERVLLELLENREINKITVSEICILSGLNRTTFYAHYLDIYDMLEKTEENLHKMLLKKYMDDGKVKNILFSDESLLTFLEHIRENMNFYRAILKTRKDFPIKQGFDSLYYDIFRPLCIKGGITSDTEIMYFFVYFQAGFTMVLRRWVEAGCSESEEMISDIIRKCLPQVLRV